MKLNLRRLRQDKDDSITRAAMYVGCAVSTIHNWEEHKRPVFYQFVRKAALYYGVTPQEIRDHNEAIRNPAAAEREEE